MVERLRSHIRQLVAVRHALVDAGALGASLTGLLDNTRACVIQVDRCGQIVAANDPAGDLLRRGEVLFAPGGFLRATRIEENAELQRLLAGAIPALGGQGTGGSMATRGSSPSRTWVVHVHPVEAESIDQSGLDRSGSRGVGPRPDAYGEPVGGRVGRRSKAGRTSPRPRVGKKGRSTGTSTSSSASRTL